jgi:hypothetical protein
MKKYFNVHYKKVKNNFKYLLTNPINRTRIVYTDLDGDPQAGEISA